MSDIIDNNKSSEETSHQGDVVDRNNEIVDILEVLNQEAQQEKQATDPERSFLEGIDAKLFVEREREYLDLEKHWVRTKAWLATAKSIQEKNRRNIRYLTLPAYYRLDVSLLHREKILEIVTPNSGQQSEEVYVAAFETDPTKYARMVGQSPKFKLFGDCSVEDALVDENNPYYDDLLALFPFDIVNLDLTTSLTPHHEGPYSKTMQAIDAIVKRQADHSSEWA